MNRKLRHGILGADLLWIACVFVFAQVLESRVGSGSIIFARVHLPPILAGISIWGILYFSKKLDCFRRGWHLPSVCAQVFVAVFLLVGALAVLAICAGYRYTRGGLVFVACVLPVGFVCIRGLAFRLVTSRSAGSIKRKAVILGGGRVARELARKIAAHPEMSMEVVGLLFPSQAGPQSVPAPPAANAISLRSMNVANLLRQNKIQELIIVEPVAPGPETEKLITRCRENGMRIHLVPQRYELHFPKAALTEIDDVPLLSLEETKVPLLGKKAKRCIDVIGALLLLIVSGPLLVLIATMLYVGKGKGFRKELRCGERGAEFWMYRLNVERESKHGYERMLAQFSVTELPQLCNVIKGEMSLVGPRPESRDRVKHYSDWQRQRLTVVPGLTGLAQVRGLREEHSSEEKARFDLQYIGQWSLFLDFSLLLQTAWALFARLVKADRFKIVSTFHSGLSRDLFARRMMHVDSTQSGAD